MRDLHTHILPGIDDGCSNEQESIKILKELAVNGVDEIVLTPHYIENSKYITDCKSKEKLLSQLKSIVKKDNIPIKLYVGNEIFFCDSILELLKDRKIEGLNNSKYLLIEFPIMNLPREAKNVFSELIYAGYKIVLAHPERYYYVMENINILKDFIDMGVLLQGNYTSLYGIYGSKSKKILKKLLRKGWVSFLCSDTHHDVKVNEKELRKKLRWIISKEKQDDLLINNFNKVVRNEEI